MATYHITINHGFLCKKENERAIFIEASSKQEAYQSAKSQLRNCGNDGWEYIVEVEEA